MGAADGGRADTEQRECGSGSRNAVRGILEGPSRSRPASATALGDRATTIASTTRGRRRRRRGAAAPVGARRAPARFRKRDQSAEDRLNRSALIEEVEGRLARSASGLRASGWSTAQRPADRAQQPARHTQVFTHRGRRRSSQRCRAMHALPRRAHRQPARRLATNRTATHDAVRRTVSAARRAARPQPRKTGRCCAPPGRDRGDVARRRTASVPPAISRPPSATRSSGVRPLPRLPRTR